MRVKSASKVREPQYAHLGPRFLALVIDLLVLGMIFFPVTKAVKGVWIMNSGDHLWGYGWLITDPLCITFLIVIFMYFVVLEGTLGATIGKRILSLRVVSEDGRDPGLARAFVRNLLRLVDGLPALNILGVILIVKSRQRARFGDRVAGTRVIVRR